MSRDYREKRVEGLIFDFNKPIPISQECIVGVMMTSDEIGQSLSLQAYNIMIEIPLESVRDIIRVADMEV